MQQADNRQDHVDRQLPPTSGILAAEGLRSSDDELPVEQLDAEVDVAADSTGRDDEQLTDEQIVDGIRHGDQAMCTYAYEKYKRLFFLGIRKITPQISPDDLEDARQNAAAFFFRYSIDAWQPGHCLSTYAHKAGQWSRTRTLKDHNTWWRGRGANLLDIMVTGAKGKDKDITYEQKLSSIAADLVEDPLVILDIERRLADEEPQLLFIFKQCVIEGETFTDVGKILGVTGERVSQILSAAIDKIKRRRIRVNTKRKASGQSPTSGVRKLIHREGAGNNSTHSEEPHDQYVHEVRPQRRRQTGEAGSDALPEETLTAEYLSVVKLIVEGHENPRIAVMLGVKLDRVKHCIREIFNKVGCDTRLQLALWAVDRNFEKGERYAAETDVVGAVRCPSDSVAFTQEAA